MAEWLIEDGIGETRAIRIESGEIVAAKVAWPGELAAGSVVEAKLASRPAGSKRGTAVLTDGTEVLVDRLAKDASEGASIRIEVTRAEIGEGSRTKRAQARPTDKPLRPAPTLADTLKAEGHAVRAVHRFPADGWDDLASDVLDGVMAFDGGSLILSPTPAMTLIDIDGALAPGPLALAAVPTIADALRRFDIGGSIGVDFPTIEAKADRRAVDDALEKALSGFAHERTAMNGFGFVQIVSRLTGPSILHRYRRHRMASLARLLVRRAEGVTEPGTLVLHCHPAIASFISDDWRAQLARRTGRQVRIESDGALAPHAGFAQAVSS
ncbi:ribonuclease E/G [Croceicoccus sediminis]|uniref:ribonuclease E/G n=1 Tax=Croceicoccus sediminis TaxID=2571150 RepID=UPI001184662D|nr:ribonuclease E/G [Croceicoccus sediminis]